MMFTAEDEADVADPQSRIGHYAKIRTGHLAAARNALARVAGLLSGFDYGDRDPERVAAAAAAIAREAGLAAAEADTYAAGFGLPPAPGGAPAASGATVEYAGPGIVAGWLGYASAADFQAAIRRHPGCPEPDGQILPGRRGPAKGWLPSSRPALEAWHASLSRT